MGSSAAKGKNMTRIRARCPQCGDVEFTVHDIVVIGTHTAACTYRFNCPTCGDRVSRTAVPEVIELLLSAGVRRELFDHPSMSPGIASLPFSERDVESFRELLSSPDWFDTLQSSFEEQ